MPRNKRGGRGARNGISQSTPREGSRSGTTSTASPHLSLLDEARNTERKHFWNADLKLRHTQVNFISAGTSGNVTEQEENGVKPGPGAPCIKDKTNKNANYLDPEQSMADMSLDPRIQATTPLVPAIVPHLLEESPSGLENSDGTRAEDRSQMQNCDLFFIDTNGYDQAAETRLPLPSVRRSNSSSSGSGDEIILFRGRGHSSQLAGTMSDAYASLTHNPTSTHPQVILVPPIRHKSAIQLPSTRVMGDLFSVPQIQPREEAKQGGVIDALDTISSPPRRLMRGRPARHKGRDEGTADYIANIQQYAELDQESSLEARHRRGLGNLEPSLLQDEIEPAVLETNPAVLASSSWSDDDLHDFDDLSTSSEILEAIGSILSKRERSSGFQYLVVWEGCTTDDAKWVPYTSLNTVAAVEMIARFEVQDRSSFNAEDDERGSDSDEDIQVIRDVAEDMLSTEEQEKKLEMMKARMIDEQTVLRLAKQEDLGVGSAKVMLFDGDELEDWADEENLKKLRAQAIQYTKPRNSKQGKPRSSYASASIFADVLDQDPYNGFDIMDQDRPSLRKRAKGQRGVPSFELSDSEFEASMQIAWDNDRTKKKLQKQHRAELRSRGLLGKKDKVDMKSEYAEGMSISQMKSEVKDFLMSDRVSVSFPPMDKKDRKLVHEFANVFNLKSKSIGGGRGRYPTLFKTSRSIQYSEGKLEDVEALLNQRRFLPHRDKGSLRGSGPRRTAGRGGGASRAAVSYRDGEVVGATAPELGTDNKGRAMLEKMGWSTGTALGALNNKGIMLPVVHVVKTTKAGLG
ncbi:hypothetical protein MMC17_001105 [Xylographa soralifera]|nr:hypothetical protein [Xylographa soralifera]